MKPVWIIVILIILAFLLLESLSFLNKGADAGNTAIEAIVNMLNQIFQAGGRAK